jgi:hypothetical protein
LSPKRTTTTSAFSIRLRVRTAFTPAPLWSAQKDSCSSPRMRTPQASLASWSVIGAKSVTGRSDSRTPAAIRSRQSLWISPER